ncbi:MAG TPA: ABC transporter ATP-binding protein [Candidatus Krumholzibacteriaceae bacterium]|nr:ABC transporter ATP-binding protein [Candidatus Krumholzibacteriaceae bacterium]
MTPIYELDKVSKSYGDVKALDNVSLVIEEGETLGVVGQSGAGKTTLLRILSGLEEPTNGSVAFNGSGFDAPTRLSLRRCATMIFQTPLFLRGDVFTNIAYGLRLRKTPEGKVRELVAEALDRVRLGGYEDRQARRLSGGEQQRAALARALVLDPEVLLVDEPTSNLDATNAKVISAIIEEEKLGRTVVVSTHDLELIKRLTGRTVFIEGGRVIEEGAPSELVSITRLSENVFTGVSRVVEGVAQIDVGNVVVRAAVDRTGRATIHVKPEDIIVSLGRIETSARNQFEGTVVGVESLDNLVLLRVDVGETFTVQVTNRSFKEMGLNVGKRVFISFKASSVIVL